MTVITKMQLHRAGDTQCLAGFDDDETSVFVLRKQTATVYALHQIPISEASQSLRSILSADDSELGELVTAILKSARTPIRKRKRKA